MTDNVENLVLEHLKRMQASLDRLERKISDLTSRVANLESGQAAIMQHLTHLAAADAAQQVAIDHISERLDRIERRLELTS
jgi:uncharacterized coiled-coil protein SlyX